MTTTDMTREIQDSLAGSADDQALQNGEITHAQHDHREWVRQMDRAWASGQVGTN